VESHWDVYVSETKRFRENYADIVEFLAPSFDADSSVANQTQSTCSESHSYRHDRQLKLIV